MNSRKQVIIYGISLAALLILLKWMEYRLLIIDHAFEIYMGMLAVLFTSMGAWLGLKLVKPRVEKVIVEKTIYVQSPVPSSSVDPLNLSKREVEVLQLMAEGLSNQEIAGRLFVSLNTIKTHSSSIYEKLDVKRRTQAVDKAKRAGILL